MGARTSFVLGFLRMSHMSEGSQKVVGPVPKAPIKPRMSPKKGNVICMTHMFVLYPGFDQQL